MPVYIVMSYFLAFAQVKIVEKDGDKYNHLFSFRDNSNRDILLHWEGKAPLGEEDSRIWLHIHEMECRKVITTDEVTLDGVPVYEVNSTTWLCTAKLVRGDA